MFIKNQKAIWNTGIINESYYLMLEDIEVCKFIVVSEKRFYTDSIESFNILREDLLPFEFTDIESWLKGRKAPNRRAHIEELLSKLNMNTLSGFIRVSKALSLTDNYWVKLIDDSSTFKEVNLFDNDFDDLIAEIAFTGVSAEPKLLSISPEYTTDGMMAKCWKKQNNDIFLLKTSKTQKSHYAEFFVSQLLRELDMLNYVKYDLVNHHDNICCSCKAFTNKERSLVTPYGLGLKNSITQVFQLYDELNCTDFFASMMLVDALIINTDRHLNNFGFLYEPKTHNFLYPAPLFDNGESLVINSNLTELKSFDSLKYKSPRIGNSFITNLLPVLTQDHVKKLSRIKDFEFEQHSTYNCDNIAIMSKIVQHQIQEVIKAYV